MKVDINVKRTFKINGKEYNSIEEMPDNLRESFKKAMGSQTDLGHQADPAAARTKIVFNDIQYESMDAMPQDVRRLYEKILQAAETGGAAPKIDLADISSSLQGETGTPGDALSCNIPQPPKFEPTYSPRTLAVIFMLGGLFLLLYYLWQSR